MKWSFNRLWKRYICTQATLPTFAQAVPPCRSHPHSPHHLADKELWVCRFYTHLTLCLHGTPTGTCLS